MKTKEQIITDTKSYVNPFRERHFNNGVEKGVDAVFKEFKERVEFYNIYRGKPIFFGNKNTELYMKFKEWHNNTFACFPNYKHTHEGEMYLEIVFNRWLFKYCFGDICDSEE